MPSGRKFCFGLPVILFFAWPMHAASLTYSGAGGDLNVATFDNINNVIEGVTQFTISVPDLGFVNPGDSVMLSLIGLQYPYAGDLRVTLTSPANTEYDVFDHIGALNPGDPGYAVQFGNSGTACSGNYNFDSSYSGDFWMTSAALGSSDSIPCGNYFPTTAFSSNNNHLSSLYSGQQIQGAWTLTIYDDYPPFNGNIGSFVPGITGWSITIQAMPISVVPEPSAAMPVALAALLCWVMRRRNTKQGSI